MPEKHSATVCLNFEIQMAQHFEYDDIHIKYEIHIPDDSQTIDGRVQLKGCTHSSRRNAIDGCWLIGYCHELTLSCKLDCLLKGKLSRRWLADLRAQNGCNDVLLFFSCVFL